MSNASPSTAPETDGDCRERWAAVVACDPSADGQFYYAVRTTGVYCRPSCRSRRPRRDNVIFHDTRAGAERAGFRPCKRCRPNEPTRAEREAATITAACQRIEQFRDTPLLAELAAHFNISPSHFHRMFRRITGLTPHQYAAAGREQRVRAELERGASVTRAILDAGYSSSGRFHASADAVLGMSPRRYRAGGTGTTIRFAVGACSLGAILVAGSERGVCAISLGDDPAELTQELQDRFPKAELIGGDPIFERYVARVVSFVEAPDIGLDLPLDIRGTAFQQRVWQALRDIPIGDTASYSDIASRIGAPGSARAIAGACGANRLAIAIPCHRVVRHNGDLSGYRWGVERKRTLLDKEAGT